MTKAHAFAAPKGIARGVNKGHVVTKRAAVVKAVSRKGKINDRIAVVRSVVRETVGFSNYERRIMEVLKGGGNNPQKRAYKFAKNRLGAHTRAKKKVKELEDAIAKIAVKGSKK